MLWFYTPFITTLLCQCLSIHGCAFSSFLPLLWCRNLSLVQAAPSSEPDYISIYRLLLTFRNLTLFMCSNLLVRYYYLSCLCLYRLALRKNKYVSWSTTPIYSVFAAISKRRFLHRKKLSTSYLRYHPQQQKEVSTLAEGKIFVSLSHLYLCILF